MLKHVICALMVPTTVFAQQNCVLQEKTINQSTASIRETTDIRKDVVPWDANQKKCIVSFKALVGDTWYSANGDFVWDGELPAGEACAAAVTRAKKDLVNSIKPGRVTSEDVLICRDDENNTQISNAQVGSYVDISQLKPHPFYPKRFYHNGAECRWFLESSWTGKDIKQYQGVACKLEPNKWVVADKF